MNWRFECLTFAGNSHHCIYDAKVQEKWRQKWWRWHGCGCNFYSHHIVHLLCRWCWRVSPANCFPTRVTGRVGHVQISVDPVAPWLCHHSSHARWNVCWILRLKRKSRQNIRILLFNLPPTCTSFTPSRSCNSSLFSYFHVFLFRPLSLVCGRL